MSFVTDKRFLIGIVAGVVLVKFVAPKLTGLPVVGSVASKVS